MKSIYIWNKPLDSYFDFSKGIENIFALIIMISTIAMMTILGFLFLYFTFVAYQYLGVVNHGKDLD